MNFPTKPAPSASPITPWRALVHPAWLAALAVLAVNDHVLKGAGLLPGALTGKLSDLAGMMVAPALLASLLAVRSRRALLGCHLAVGAVFAAIQLSAPAAHAVEAATAWAGFAWIIIMDPTDLLALPVLLVSWRVLLPAMSRPVQVVRLRRRVMELASASLGLLCSMGTSVVEPPPMRTFFGDVFLYNDTEDRTFTLQVQPLKASVSIECNVVMSDPGRFAQPELFDVAQIWEIGAGEAGNLRAVVGDGDGDEAMANGCQVYRVSVTGVPDPVVVAWWRVQIPEGTYRFPGDEGDATPLDEAPGLVKIEFADDGAGSLVSPNREDLLHRVRPAPEPEASGLCAEQSDADRLAWDFPPGSARWRVESITGSPDGCSRLELRDPDAVASEGPSQTAYVCVRPNVFPFAPGEWIQAFDQDGELRMQVVEQDGAVVQPTRVLYLGVGNAHLYLPGDLTASATPIESCAPAVHDICGTLAQPAEVEVSRLQAGGAELLRAREGVSLPGNDGSEIYVHLVHALDRFTTDADCTLGGASLRPEYELWAVYRGG